MMWLVSSNQFHMNATASLRCFRVNLLCCIFSKSFSSASELEKNMQTLRSTSALAASHRGVAAARLHSYVITSSNHFQNYFAFRKALMTACKKAACLLMSNAVSMRPTTLLITCNTA